MSLLNVPQTLPLISPAAHPDACHQVNSPGGYEWWYFDAEDTANDRQIVAIFLDGFVFHPGYLRAYGKYLRRPTRHAPPVPKQFRCAYFCVYERGKILAQIMRHYQPDDFRARTDRPDVSLASNQFHLADDGSLNVRMRGIPWKLTWQGPKQLDSQTLAGEFVFRPQFNHPPMERTFLSRAMTGADHHWVIANPACDVSGVIELFDAEGSRPLMIDFNGRGYHDHNYGTAPLGKGLKRWIWGRALSEEGAMTFHFARPRDPSLADEIHLVQVDSKGVREIAVQNAVCDWSKHNATGLAYPARLTLDDVLELSHPRLIDSSPFYLRLMYQSSIKGKKGQAFCEVAYPHRLRWPILGRMIEMSIGK